MRAGMAKYKPQEAAPAQSAAAAALQYSMAGAGQVPGQVQVPMSMAQGMVAGQPAMVDAASQLQMLQHQQQQQQLQQQQQIQQIQQQQLQQQLRPGLMGGMMPMAMPAVSSVGMIPGMPGMHGIPGLVTSQPQVCRHCRTPHITLHLYNCS